MRTLKQNYQFGDVIYGRSGARKIYMKEEWLDPVYENKDVFLESEKEKFERTSSDPFPGPVIKKDVLQQLIKSDHPPAPSVEEPKISAKEMRYLTIDELNNHTDYVNIFERDAYYEDYTELDQEDSTPHGTRTYWKALMNSKFSPERLPKLTDEEADMEWDELTKKHVSIAHMSEKLDRSGLTIQRQKLKYLALRRACKFGIAYMVDNGKRVHFVLDGINMWDVAKKKRVEFGNEKPGVSITTSELRYVYRNWSTIEGKVFFYLHNAEVKPPWQWDVAIQFPGMTDANPPTVKKLWEMYKDYRVHEKNSLSQKKD